MRFALAGSIALTLTSGCLRFGYDLEERQVLQQADAAPRGGSPSEGLDASLPHDAGTHVDAAPGFDAGRAAEPDAMAGDAAVSAADAAIVDASIDAAAQDAASSAPMDAALATDAAANDACVSCAELTFSNGFEDSSGWSAPTQINGTLQRTAAQAHSGSSALYASTGPASSAKTVRQETRAFSNQATGDVWARAWILLPDTTTIDTATSIATLRIGEGEAPFFGCAVAIRSDRVELAGVTTTLSAQTPFPRDTWTCVELHIYIDDDTGSCEAYVDTVVAAQASPLNTVRANGYTALSVGVEYSNGAQPAVELYFDDVAAGTERIPCE